MLSPVMVTVSVICPPCAPVRPIDGPGEYELKDPTGAHVTVAASHGGAIGAILGGALALASAAPTGGLSLLVAGPLLAGAAGGAVAGGFIGAMMTRGAECDGPDPIERLAVAEHVLYAAGAEPVALSAG